MHYFEFAEVDSVVQFSSGIELAFQVSFKLERSEEAAASSTSCYAPVEDLKSADAVFQRDH